MSVRLLTIAAIATFLSSLALAQSKGVGMSAREPGRRLALVIGNSAYETGPLRNPVNDARDMASALEAVGFRVTLLTDAEHQRMEEAIDAFGLALRPEDVGLFYYSGHGVQVRGENYLIPVDANPKRATVLKFEAVNAARVLGMMEAAGNRLNLVILDACRNNPFRGRFRSLDPGLARMDAPTGTLVAYATAPGQVAEDGAGRNSPYTGALLRHLPTPGLKVEDFFKRVRADVERATRKAQVPWEATSLKGDFYFAGLGGAGPAALTAPPAAASAPGLPTNPEAARLLRMGRLFRERSRPQKALESFETLVREHAGTAEALDGNAELLELLIAREGLTHSVEDRLTEFEARHPGAPQVARVREQAAQWLVEQGGSATAAGKAEEAETLFGKAFSYGADGGAVREKRIEGLIAAGRLEQAEEALVAWRAEGRADPRAAALMRSLDEALRLMLMKEDLTQLRSEKGQQSEPQQIARTYREVKDEWEGAVNGLRYATIGSAVLWGLFGIQFIDLDAEVKDLESDPSADQQELANKRDKLDRAANRVNLFIAATAITGLIYLLVSKNPPDPADYSMDIVPGIQLSSLSGQYRFSLVFKKRW